MNYQEHNAAVIDRWVEEGWEWGKPIDHAVYEAALHGEWSVRLTPTKPVPHAWFGELKGRRVLGLASGGGQQMPVFAALGARCTVLDYSERQLESERLVAAREVFARLVGEELRELDLVVRLADLPQPRAAGVDRAPGTVGRPSEGEELLRAPERVGVDAVGLVLRALDDALRVGLPARGKVAAGELAGVDGQTHDVNTVYFSTTLGPVTEIPAGDWTFITEENEFGQAYHQGEDGTVPFGTITMYSITGGYWINGIPSADYSVSQLSVSTADGSAYCYRIQ